MLPIRRISGILPRYAVIDRVRWASTKAPPSKDKYKILVLGGGASESRKGMIARDPSPALPS
jgi:hypothetical protein